MENEIETNMENCIELVSLGFVGKKENQLDEQQNRRETGSIGIGIVCGGLPE